ncbi:hypothetical protein [Pseudoxanthomonas winnipegensis]|uniref:hypothetical protein n=1 Tax=Pseudoxanthomonas winnipegensis TaxID=2480810 RepID=UPI00103A9EB9|nr:hypothetical protein [Pseudoxanthomonas winnipegensis]TBV72244.1 hypothetical protein EYC45_15720 [Pseudoxanthomonas winnipegensis]
MFNRLPFPWVYVLEVLLAAPLFASFYLVVAFAASQPADAVRATGAAIPTGWEAAVPNHGGYIRGFLPSAHPVLLCASTIALLAFGVIAWQLRLAQAAQSRSALTEHVTYHKVAAAITFGGWALVAWLLVTFGLPQLAAA